MDSDVDSLVLPGRGCEKRLRGHYELKGGRDNSRATRRRGTPCSP